MALSGPLFTEMNDGEVQRHGAASVAFLGGSIAFLVVFGGLWVGSVLAFALGKLCCMIMPEEQAPWQTLALQVSKAGFYGGSIVSWCAGIIDKAGNLDATDVPGCSWYFLLAETVPEDGSSWQHYLPCFALLRPVLRESGQGNGAGIKIVFMARSLPILPAEVFDYACAMTTLAVHEYAIGCIGSAVPVAFWTFSTAQASNLVGPERSRASHVALILLNVGCLVLLTFVLVHVIQSHEQDAAEETIDIEWQEQWMDAKMEVAHRLQAENLQIYREGRDFTIRDNSNKLLQLWDDHGMVPYLLRKWEKKHVLTKENFPLKVHVHKEPPLVNDLIEPAILAVKRTSSSTTPTTAGSPEHLYARVDSSDQLLQLQLP
ncbi:unnamed protein product [Cladocopium goreaui]|uniref:Membrane protein n=1 Tax=Cladocopium goreaui TaxID=2562237 RepID=A0A9P1FJF7_9DINO|nr:unnamed protein product [Cladocopium goreaui]